MMETIIAVRKAQFETEERIAVFFPKQDDLINKIRKVPERRWSAKHQCWHFPYNSEYWNIFKSLFQHASLNIQSQATPLMIPFYEMIAYPALETKFKNEIPIVTKETSEINQQQQIDYQAFVKKLKKENPTKIIVTIADFWRGKLRIDLPYITHWIDFIKEIEGKYWHTDLKCWTIPHSPLTLNLLKNRFGENLYIDLSNNPYEERAKPAKSLERLVHDTPQYEAEITKLEEQLILKRYTFKTIKTYKSHFALFIAYYNHIHPADISKEQIIQYVLYRIKTQHISESSQNTTINAIKCYYEQVLGRDRTFYDLQRPKKPFHLPNVMSENEIAAIIKSIGNIKHKCMILAIYSGGLRLNELLNLRKQDISEERNCIFIKAGKGKKDRYTLLSPKLLEYLKIYYQHYTPQYWLFEGAEGGQYSARSVQKILETALQKSGINATATIHTLRHSFATHLLSKGVALRYIQELLGHESIKTTEIYMHITADSWEKLKSPLDNLNI